MFVKREKVTCEVSSMQCYFSKSCDKTLVLHFFGLKKCEKDFFHFDDSFLTSDV